MVKAINIMTILCLAAFTGCAAKQPQRQSMMPVTKPALSTVAFERDINKRDPESLASIFSDEASRDFYQDLRAYKVGDLVTINIVETSKASKSASTHRQAGTHLLMQAFRICWDGKVKLKMSHRLAMMMQEMPLTAQAC